jgi:hypothetical protein
VVANRILHVVLTILAWIVLPLEIVTTFVLGILVSITFGILLLPISLVWTLLFFGPLLGLSWFCQKVPSFRNLVGILFLPWAVLGSIFVCLMPSMGELENRTVKLMLCNSWPFSWEFWCFSSGRLDFTSSNSPEAIALNEVIARISRRDALMQRVVMRIINREELDPNF